jgi:uncharacterized protein (DUF433 family)
MNLPSFFTRDPDGEVRLTGHRIGLYTVVRSYQEGCSAEQVAADFPSLPLALVYKVLAFYLENREEVEAYVEAYRAELERQEAAHVPGPGAVHVRSLMELLRQAEALHGSDPVWSALPVQEKLRRIGQETPAEAP